MTGYNRPRGSFNSLSAAASHGNHGCVMNRHLGLLAIIALPIVTLTLRAADWPQFRGPQRDGVSRETGLRKDWPADGPPLLWTYTGAGVGYSGPAVVGDRLYMCGGRGDSEYVFAL